jgi:hypothetical protein
VLWPYIQSVIDMDSISGCKVNVMPQQAEVAQGVLVRLRPRIFLTFGTTRVVGRQPYAPATFTPGENPGTHFQGLSLPQGIWFRRRGSHGKNPHCHHRESIPGLVAQCLNHYVTPDPISRYINIVHIYIIHTCYCYSEFGISRSSS